MRFIICILIGHTYTEWWIGYDLQGRQCRRCENLEIKSIYDTL